MLRDASQRPPIVRMRHRCGSVAMLLSMRPQASSNTAFKALPDLVLRQLAADEDDAAFPLLIGPPRALVIAVEDHVHALEHEPLVVILEREHALAAQDAG